MSSDPVAPLRISKSTPNTSPTKMASSTTRPLSEVSPMGIRRNSPSINQSTKGLFKGDSSPFDSSPVNANSTSSPRLFWQGREPTASPGRLSSENRNPFERENATTSPSKRSSIENLKKASRVKNSTMFEREHRNEYDPSRVTQLERPLASGRPLSMQFQGNAFGGKGLDGWRKTQDAVTKSKSPDQSVLYDPAASVGSDGVAPPSPSKSQTSPMKSSLSRKTGGNVKNGFDPETGIWSEDEDTMSKLPDGRILHRFAKSVTFDQAPPQINEYEMTTPDPSSIASDSREGSYDSNDEYDEDISYERGSSIDHEDSFDASLEDTDKTPVVLPEDWRFMSPDTANDELAKHEEDPFSGEYGSPEPTATPVTQVESRQHQASVNSVDSNGQSRPLPPLPPLSPSKGSPFEGNKRFSGTLERVSSVQRSLPTPPRPASISKSDLKGMGRESMGLEDRLRLMMIQDQSPGRDKSEAEKQRERRMRRAGSKDRSPAHDSALHGVESDAGLTDRDETEDPADSLPSPPRISRESILAKIRGKPEYDYDDDDDDEDEEESQLLSSSPARPLPIDPDIPIPSLEDDTQADADEPVIIKEEQEETDLYAIPDLYSRAVEASLEQENDDASEYSQASLIHAPVLPPSLGFESDGQDTPRANSPARAEVEVADTESKHMTLPTFSGFEDHRGFDLGLHSYLSQSPKLEKTLSREKELPLPPRPATPEAQPQKEEEEPRTPDSVIHHSISNDDGSDSYSVEEPIATVKASGGKLKTRPSLTPADLSTMAATRRQISGQFEPQSPTRSVGGERTSLEETQVEPNTKTRISSLVQLEIPNHDGDDGLGLGLGLDKEFDRVIEAQKVAFAHSLSLIRIPFHGRFPSAEYSQPKGQESSTANLSASSQAAKDRGLPLVPKTSRIANRTALRQKGYLMRQNTKVVVASSRNEESENINNVLGTTTNRKPSQQTWTTEPWNSKSRRKSIRTAGSPRKRAQEGPVPPLPGQASNVDDGLASVDENDTQEDDDISDDSERGRVFVKVVGVKDLDLPLPRNERAYFALTLDNGLHCVTTAWLELGRSAPIGQEFELVVMNDLEFQLTLQMKLEEPKSPVVALPTKAPVSPKKQSAFSRVFGSPKKRKDSESKLIEIKRSVSPVRASEPTLYDMVQGLVARDGSFGRAYVSLSEHEKRCFGRPYTVDITCFNEWAMEDVSSGSQKNKKGGLQRRPPYKIGKLELQLLYVPKPKGAKDEDMPRSMNACIREMREAETCATTQWEGHLSQQGGDCPYWRRRFFRLNGTKLTAYHESTLQPRANINLSKAVKVIDDKSSLTKKETSTKGGGRRKSGFAEEEEGYMFVEEGFRIRFANGEVIDFYADNAPDKQGWMKALSDTVGKSAASSQAKAWTDLVLKQEQVHGKKIPAKQPAAHPSPRKSSRDANVAPQHSQAHPQTQARSAKDPFNMSGGLPAQAQYSPQKAMNPRGHQRPTHSRTESHQAIPTTSPTKEKMATRHQKSRSVADFSGLSFR